jgi:rubrerythrin
MTERDSFRTPTHQALDEALDDEYRSRAKYRAILTHFGPVRPFVNIVEAEHRHVAALCAQYERLGLGIPSDPWPGQVTVPATLEEACRAGVDDERANGVMYERLLAMSTDSEVSRVFRNLRDASQLRHLPAFQ